MGRGIVGGTLIGVLSRAPPASESLLELSSGYLRDNFGMRVNVFYVPNKGTF